MASKKGNILVVDDNAGIRSALGMLLPLHFASATAIASPKTLLTAIRERHIDVVLLDMNFDVEVNTGNEGLFWLGEIKRSFPECRVVLFTAYADINLAVEGMKRGAFDFVVKPWDNAKLISILSTAVGASKSPRTTTDTQGTMLWGRSMEMCVLKDNVEKLAPTDATILITGENGTGKDVLAKEIHRRSLRSSKPMVAVDLGAIPETLFESEMFGVVKGAFTDAVRDREGKFEAADCSTLFLDEIGNLSPASQSKLLRVLQERRITRVGSNNPLPINIRLICATNRNLEQDVAEGRFREDLYYRINTLHLHLPPLRERRDEIVPLAEMFVRRYAAMYDRKVCGVDDQAAKTLTSLPWNGNIRELQNAVERAVILAEGGRLNLDGVKNSAIQPLRSTDVHEGTLEDMERGMIRQAIAKCGGNLTMVAQQLGITRQTLYNKLKKYDIHC